jgi:hypothetical protein
MIVIPAQAGIQAQWTPALAGVTAGGSSRLRVNCLDRNDAKGRKGTTF